MKPGSDNLPMESSSKWGRRGEDSAGLQEGGVSEIVRWDLGKFHAGVGEKGLEGEVVVGESSDERIVKGDGWTLDVVEEKGDMGN